MGQVVGGAGGRPQRTTRLQPHAELAVASEGDHDKTGRDTEQELREAPHAPLTSSGYDPSERRREDGLLCIEDNNSNRNFIISPSTSHHHPNQTRRRTTCIARSCPTKALIQERPHCAGMPPRRVSQNEWPI